MYGQDQEKTSIEDTLEERGKRYGNFSTHADITQSIKHSMRGVGITLDAEMECYCAEYKENNWDKLSNSQREALDMIAHKIGRILNGDPNYIDSYRDIVGYAQLVVEELERTDGATDAETKIKKRSNGTWV